jgi:replication factor A1
MPTVAAVYPIPMADITQQQEQQQQQSRFPLRRAVYVHVSDLTNAYNIDHPKLEHELSKVKEGNEENATPEEREELDLSTGDGENSISSMPLSQSRRKSLHPPRAGFNLCVLVGSVKVVVDKFRVDRSRVRLAEVEVGDETGIVSLRARDDQIEALQEISKREGAVVIRNCSVELFQGKYIRIAVTKWGKLTPYPDSIASTPPPPTKINRERNFSSIDLSLVASELMEMSPSEAAFSPQSQYRAVDNAGNRSGARQQQTTRHQQYQQMQQTRPDKKYSRDRRQQQQRPKQAGMSPSRGMHYPDSSMQGAHMSGMRYSGIPSFTPSYGDGSMDHFHSQGGRAAHSHQASTQHLLMQQYEMHQRQLQQMHAYHEQQDRSHQPMMHQHAHQMMGSTSFDTSGDYSVSSPVSGPGQSMHLVGNNPMLIRVSMTSQHDTQSPSRMVSGGSGNISGPPETFRPYVQAVQEGGAFVAVHQAGDSEASSEAWAIPIPPASSFVSKDDSPLSPGHMNPQAAAFAPAYQQDPSLSETRQPMHSYGYVPYDPSTAGTMYSQPPAYNQNVMYMQNPSGNTSSTATSTEHSPEKSAENQSQDEESQK